jgi:hypothetical protein
MGFDDWLEAPYQAHYAWEDAVERVIEQRGDDIARALIEEAREDDPQGCELDPESQKDRDYVLNSKEWEERVNERAALWLDNQGGRVT